MFFNGLDNYDTRYFSKGKPYMNNRLRRKIAQPSPSGLAWTVFDERNLLLLKLDLYTVEFAY